MKKALAGPAKRTAKARKLPERRAMIAAARRRVEAALAVASTATRRVDRAVARRLEAMRPPLQRRLRQARVAGVRLSRAAWKRLRPLLVLLLRAFSRAERALLRARDVSIRAATRASAAITPRRAVAGVVIASAALLIVAQFIAYRGVEVGQPGYAGLTIASPPTKAVRTAGQAHAYLLVPVALIAAIVAAMTMRSERRGLGRIVIALGALSLAVILLVDLPAGLDAGTQTSYFSGATAVLEDGFYAELAAAAGLLIGGLLYYARPCRIRTNWSGRVASARRRRRRRRDSSPRRAARRSSPPRSGAASAPASPR
jgi:hypothetical protein